MKQAIKALLPRPFIDEAVDFRDRLRLAITPRPDFAPGKLRPAQTLNLSQLFADEAIAARWEEDHHAITGSFGHDDRFEGVNPGDRRAIYYLVMALRPRNVLEIGTHIGASTIHIAAALKQLDAGGGVTTVDIIDVNDPTNVRWKRLGVQSTPRDHIDRLGLSNQVAFRTAPGLEFLTTTERRFDLIFLDGDHSAPAVYQEVAAALPLLNEGGLILLHDYYPGGRVLYPDQAMIRGPFRAMERVRRECPAIAVVPLGELPWPTKQGVKATSLALVAKADA